MSRVAPLPVLSRFSCRSAWQILAVVFLVNSLAIGWFIQFALGEPTSTPALAWAFLRLKEAGTDSWEPMLMAIEYLRQHEGVQLYRKLFFEDKVKFQYPLTSLLPLDVFQQITGHSREQLYPLFNAVSWFSVLLIGVASWLIFSLHSQPDGSSTLPKDRWANAWHLVLILAITLTFYPVSKAWMLGQIQTWITLLVALTLLAWMFGKPVVAGVLLGICCAIKPQWAVIFLWGMLRREWRFVGSGLATFAALAIPAVLLYGLQNFFDYLSVLSYIGQRGEAFFQNQSINGLMNRLLFNGSNFKWSAHEFPPFNLVVYVATLGSSIVLLGTTLLLRRKEKANVLDLAFIVLGVSMASPIAWEHHYAILLPIYALMLKVVLDERGGDVRWLLALGFSFFLVSQNLGFLNYFRDSVLNVFQSYRLFGAFIALYLLYRLNAKRHQASA